MKQKRDEYTGIDCQHDPEFLAEADEPTISEQTQDVYKDLPKRYSKLFINLDGTVIKTYSGKTFPKGLQDMKFKMSTLQAIKRAKPEIVCIVTNQGGIGAGYVTEEGFKSKLAYVEAVIREYTGIPVISQYCTSLNRHDPNRKPNYGMLELMLFDTNKSDCIMVGDASGIKGQFSDSDKVAAENFGIDYLDVNQFIKTWIN